MAPFHTTRRVEFAETDAAGIMHFSAFFRLMEQVEHEMLRSLGTSVVGRDAEGNFGWPRVHARCDYLDSVRFEDVMDVALEVVRLGEKSVTYNFTFTHDGRPIADGQITAVYCRLQADQPPKSTPIPSELADRLRTYLQE